MNETIVFTYLQLNFLIDVFEFLFVVGGCCFGANWSLIRLYTILNLGEDQIFNFYHQFIARDKIFIVNYNMLDRKYHRRKSTEQIAITKSTFVKFVSLDCRNTTII